MGSRKSALQNLILLLLGCLAALALLEVLLRLFPPFEIRFKPDRIVLPVNKRYLINNDGKFTRLDKRAVYTKNSLGFRGPPPPDHFGDYLTIVAVGGSTTECFYLSDDQTWPYLLGKKLERVYDRVWLNNAGLDGATTYRHLILLEDYLVQLKPKYVLFLAGINDIGLGPIEGDNNPQASSFHRFGRMVLNHSEVYSLGQNIYRFFVAQRRGLHHKEFDFQHMPTLETVSPERQQGLLKEHKEKYLPYFEQRLVRLVSLCRQHGMEPVLITQSVLYGHGVDETTGVNWEKIKVGDEVNGELMGQVVELYNDVTRKVGRDREAPVIDLGREFPKDSRYYYDFLHYTAQGAQKAADIIFKDLCPVLSQRQEMK